jgi:hypothetical protein
LLFFLFPYSLLLLSPLRKKETIFRYFENNGETRARAAAFFFTVAFTHANNHRGRERERYIRSATTRLAVVVALETGDDPIVHMTNIVTRAGSMKKKKKTAILSKTTSKLENKEENSRDTKTVTQQRAQRKKRRDDPIWSFSLVLVDRFPTSLWPLSRKSNSSSLAPIKKRRFQSSSSSFL